MTTYITVAIPYVNAAPHLGYAYELIEADLAVRARRALGDDVRLLGGTDDDSLKNVLAAEAAGETTTAFVDRHADRFEALAAPLGVGFDDFIRTSRDPRHQPAVERLWRACAEDLYRRDYTGSYCVGCEQFYDDLVDDRCPEHDAELDVVTETNWFFRLSSYTDRLIELIETDALQITPDPFRAEILAFVRRGLDDISVSRSVERARGWGIGVPDDPTQVIYVWFDALTNYISALDFGTEGDRYDRWWRASDDRIHVVGKGITRFHAVYWPAFLLSAGEPVPTQIHVHPYLSVDGSKISKSSGVGVSPTELVDRFGTDALRWWIASDVSPTTDTDFTVERLVGGANETLANGFGNAVNRVVALRRGRSIEPPTATGTLRHRIATSLAEFDRRTATDLIVAAIDAVNRRLDAAEPWKLLRDPATARHADEVLDRCGTSLIDIADAIELITPEVAARARDALTTDRDRPTPVFARLDAPR